MDDESYLALTILLMLLVKRKMRHFECRCALGMGAAEVIQSSLPFGVGSFSDQS